MTEATSHASPEQTAPARSSRGTRRLIAAALAVAVVLAGVLLVVAVRGVASSETITIDVPPGTGQRLDAGAQVELLPRILRVEVGDDLVVTNRDERPHQVGPYTVAAGQTLRQEFTTPGTIEGICTLHPSGAVSIVVS